MKYLKEFKLFENINELTIDYLEKNHPVKLDEFFSKEFNKERFFIMIDDKPSYFSDFSGFNETKNRLYLILKEDGMIKNDRVDIPIIKQYLRSFLNK